MTKTSVLIDIGRAKVTPADVRRFETVAQIDDPAAFAAALDEFIKQKISALRGPATRTAALSESFERKATELRAETRWAPSATDIQRGRSAMLQMFERPSNLPLPEFARLAHKSRQQIYKDLAATPKRLLALSVGSRKQRLPDWQLDPLRIRLTREVLKGAERIDAWTIYQALSAPAEALRDRSPVDALTPSNFRFVVATVFDTLGIHATVEPR